MKIEINSMESMLNKCFVHLNLAPTAFFFSNTSATSNVLIGSHLANCHRFRISGAVWLIGKLPQITHTLTHAHIYTYPSDCRSQRWRTTKKTDKISIKQKKDTSTESQYSDYFSQIYEFIQSFLKTSFIFLNIFLNHIWHLQFTWVDNVWEKKVWKFSNSMRNSIEFSIYIWKR